MRQLKPLLTNAKTSKLLCMNKTKPNLKDIIPNLSGKERAHLFIKSVYAKEGFLTNEEEQMLKTFKDQRQLDEFQRCLHLASTERMTLMLIFLDTFSDFRYHASLLLWFYAKIYYETPLRMMERFFKIVPQFLTEKEYYAALRQKQEKYMYEVYFVQQLAEYEAFTFLCSHKEEYPPVKELLEKNEVLCAFDFQLLFDEDNVVKDIWERVVAEQRNKIEVLIQNGKLQTALDGDGKKGVLASSWYTCEEKLDTSFNDTFDEIWKEDAMSDFAVSHSYYLTQKDDAGKNLVEIEKQSLMDFIDKLSLLEIEVNFDTKTELISFKGDMKEKLQMAVMVLTQQFEQLVSLREAIRRVDKELGNPSYPQFVNGERLDGCLQEAKIIQKRHNDAIFYLLKPSWYLEPLGFKREMKDFNAFILKTPKINEEIVQQFVDLVVVESTRR